MSPVLDTTPGSTEWAGPDLGQHTNEILKDLLKMSDGDINALGEQGVVKLK
jgi:crotonobetainyl-CoA:carnitine CoA-transferase CaiB-like acyl-CoA transferase